MKNFHHENENHKSQLEKKIEKYVRAVQRFNEVGDDGNYSPDERELLDLVERLREKEEGM